jgi:hypothetical protein
MATNLIKLRRNERHQFKKNVTLDVKLFGNTLPHSASKHIILNIFSSFFADIDDTEMIHSVQLCSSAVKMTVTFYLPSSLS